MHELFVEPRPPDPTERKLLNQELAVQRKKKPLHRFLVRLARAHWLPEELSRLFDLLSYSDIEVFDSLDAGIVSALPCAAKGTNGFVVV
jgi:hypothetical protein